MRVCEHGYRLHQCCEIEDHEAANPQRQDADGSWSSAEPLDWQGDGINGELSGKRNGLYLWSVFNRHERVADGVSRVRRLALRRVAQAVRAERVSLMHSRTDLLAEYCRHQSAEGATLADDAAIARAQGEAWRRYVEACNRDGVTPESMDRRTAS